MEHLFVFSVFCLFLCFFFPPLFILSVLVLDGQILESFNWNIFRFDLKQRWNILRSLEQILNPVTLFSRICFQNCSNRFYIPGCCRINGRHMEACRQFPSRAYVQKMEPSHLKLFESCGLIRCDVRKTLQLFLVCLFSDSRKHLSLFWFTCEF